MDDKEIPGYVYVGDVNVADYGGKWIGVTRENCGHVIEVLGADNFDDGKCLVTSGDIFVRGHVEMRQAIESCGWDIRGIEDRTQRQAMMLEAYHGYYGADLDEDFMGRHEEWLNADDGDDAVIAQANRWAR